MKKQPILFAALLVLGLTSFVWYERRAAPIEESLRQEYLSKFAKVSLPYRLDADNSVWKTAPSLNNRDYEPFIPDLGHNFSRKGPSNYSANVFLASKDSFDVLIYCAQRETSEAYAYILQVLDKKGEIIDTQYLMHFDYYPNVQHTTKNAPRRQAKNHRDFILVDKDLGVYVQDDTGWETSLNKYQVGVNGKIRQETGYPQRL